MRDFSVLAFAITALFLGALIMLHDPNQPALVGLAKVDEERTFVPQLDLPPSTPTPVAQPDQPPPPPPNDSPVARIRIPGINVDAKIIEMGVDSEGYMEVPSEPLEVAWYKFTSHPSFGSNAVFAGHVDSARIGPAIFWRLRQVVEGDEVQVALQDGTTYAYRVISTTTFTSNDAPVQEIIGPTEKASITIITCDGTFNTRTHEYDKRLIVRAEMILPDSTASN